METGLGFQVTLAHMDILILSIPALSPGWASLWLSFLLSMLCSFLHLRLSIPWLSLLLRTLFSLGAKWKLLVNFLLG